MAADQVVAHPTTITGASGHCHQVQHPGAFLTRSAWARKPSSQERRKISFRPSGEHAGGKQILRRSLTSFMEIPRRRLSGRKDLDRAAVVKLADGRIYTASRRWKIN